METQESRKSIGNFKNWLISYKVSEEVLASIENFWPSLEDIKKHYVFDKISDKRKFIYELWRLFFESEGLKNTFFTLAILYYLKIFDDKFLFRGYEANKKIKGSFDILLELCLRYFLSVINFSSEKVENILTIVKGALRSETSDRIVEFLNRLYTPLISYFYNSLNSEEKLDIADVILDLIASLFHYINDYSLKIEPLISHLQRLSIPRPENIKKHTSSDPSLKIETSLKGNLIKVKEEKNTVETIEPIGRVAPTLETPSTPTKFYFWAVDRDDINIELGSVVTAYPSHNEDQVVGLITDIEVAGDVETLVDSFYSYDMGNPQNPPPSKPPIITKVEVEVVKRRKGRYPIRSSWLVRWANEEEIIEAYCGEIPISRRVLAGFTKNTDGKWNVPIYLDREFVLGPEAAHVNITGTSGVATKTSYALFLITSLLSSAKDELAVIAFNVKEVDLLQINLGLESIEALEEPLIELSFNEKMKSLIDPLLEHHFLWEKAEQIGIKPIIDVSFFLPNDTEYSFLSNSTQINYYSYALRDLARVSLGALLSLFNPEDIDDKIIALMSSIREEVINATKWSSFEELLKNLRENNHNNSQNTSKNPKRRRREYWIKIGDTVHHFDTVQKALNRLGYTVKHQLSDILIYDSYKSSNPIDISTLKAGQLWIIDISQLPEKGQRLIFQVVTKKIFDTLIKKKSLKLSSKSPDEKEKWLLTFPNRVLIFVDELNKFVPSKGSSPIKSEIIEIVSRGRSVGLSLLGAQQLASKIDEEVIANTSTFVIGRSHVSELNKSIYSWIPQSIRKEISTLPRGQLLLWHVVHNKPVYIKFPMPVHRLWQEIHRLKEMSK